MKQFDIGSSNSFVIFEALNNGPHSVTVFAIMDNGGLLSGGISRGVHRETINLTGTPSTSAATTDHISDPLTTTISLSTSIDVSTNSTCNSSGVYHNFIIDSHFSIISHLIDNSDNNNGNNNKQNYLEDRHGQAGRQLFVSNSSIAGHDIYNYYV